MLGALLGNYRVLSKLGEGGMGEVYVGRHEALGHRVAIKLLLLELSRNAEMVRRFFNEAQAATAIRHLGIVQIFDFGTAPDGRAYFVMELLEGQSLAARLKQRRLDYAECCRLGRQVANVLQAAHAAGITHRDLKPDNLFLIPDAEVTGGERVKVLDFGLAKLAGGVDHSGVKTRTDMVMGTPSYMSPEQCRGASAVDARSDIYSLGCILFEMACSRPPFVGEGAGGILGAHQYEDPPQPRSLAPDIPSKLAKLILGMLAKQPTARPQTMATVGQELEEILRALDGAPKRAPKRAPTPLPAPQAAPMSTTLGGSAGTSSAGAGTRTSRLPFVVGGFIVAGALTIAIVVGARDADPPGPGPADAAAGVASADAARLEDATQIAVTPTTPPDAAEQAPTPDAAAPVISSGSGGELEVECLRYRADQKWDELDACADRLKSTNPALAKELKARANLETKALPRVTAFENALKERNLKRAKAELEALANVSRYAQLKQRYEQAENAAIQDMASRLERAKDDDCKEYNQIVQQEKAAKPSRVAAEATRQVTCKPVVALQPAACDHEELAKQGYDQYTASQLAVALASYDAAYRCKPELSYAVKSYIIACNIPNVAKAKLYWKRLTPEKKRLGLDICVRNNISEEMLNAP